MRSFNADVVAYADLVSAYFDNVDRHAAYLVPVDGNGGYRLNKLYVVSG
jgi:hypothetical protein